MSPYYEIVNLDIFGDGDIADVIEDIFTTEYKATEQNYNKGDIVPYHSHAHTENLVLVRGHVRMIIEEEIIDLKAGEMVVIEPWAIHMCAFPQGAAQFYVCFPRAKK